MTAQIMGSRGRRARWIALLLASPAWILGVALYDTAPASPSVGELSCSIDAIDTQEPISAPASAAELAGNGSCSWPGSDQTSVPASFALSGQASVEGCPGSPRIVIDGPLSITLADEQAFSMQARFQITQTIAGEPIAVSQLTTDSGQTGGLTATITRVGGSAIGLAPVCNESPVKISQQGSLTSLASPSVAHVVGKAGAVVAPPPPDALTGPGSAGELTAQQIAKARELMVNDAYFQEALDGNPYSITSIGPWTTMGNLEHVSANTLPDGSRLLGADLEIKLDRAIQLTPTKLPAINYDEAENEFPPYVSFLATVTASQLRSLSVVVDLNTQKVVQVLPAPGSEGVTFEETEPFTPVAPAGDGSK